MDKLQFYPTPKELAIKAWAKFNNRDFSRVLEPSAGRGDLLSVMSEDAPWRNPIADRVDVIEINIENHPILRDKGYRVIDLDFLKHKSAVGYSHIILNPPFREGVDHVLHAFDLLHDGELVAILNAETIENPHTAKRRLLVRLIEEHGEVEFVDAAFEDPDTLRRTSVRVALVHMEKHERIELPPVWQFLKEDDREGIDTDVSHPQELAIPNSTIMNVVRAFDAAVESMKASVVAQATANYYAGLISTNLHDRNESAGAGSEPHETTLQAPTITFDRVQGIINKRYDELKENAWRKVLEAADFSSRFTNKVRQRIEKEIDHLIHMSFTVDNVHSLLGGLIANKTELDMQSVEDAFDLICQYHSDNKAYYRGWKSNDAHRLGWRIKSRRFILPNMGQSYSDGIGYDAFNIMDDLDRAFALLDGKTDTDYSMRAAAGNNKQQVLSAQRIRSEYFEFRFYNGAKTMHFFPIRQDLVDRMNRIVGKRRQWLPDSETAAPQAFWDQYDAAEKVTREMDKELNEATHYWRYKEKRLEKLYEEAREKLGVPRWDGLTHQDAVTPQENLVLPLGDERAA